MSDQEKKRMLRENRENRNGGERETGYRFMDQQTRKRPVNRKAVVLRLLGIVVTGAAIGAIASLVFWLTQPQLREAAEAKAQRARVTIPAEPETDSDIAPEPEAVAEDSADRTEAAEAAAQEPQVTTEAAAVQQEEMKDSADAAFTDTAGDTDGGQAADPAEEAGTDPAGPADDGGAEIAAEAPEETQPENAAETPGDAQPEDAAETPGDAQPEDAAETPDDAQPEDAAETPDDAEPEDAAETSLDAQPEDDAEAPDDAQAVGVTIQEYRQLYKTMTAVAEEPEKALVQVIGITSEMDYFNRNYENQQRISGLNIAMTDTDLFILTEYRVVDQVERIQVVFANGTMTDATFQKADQNTGLAVLKVPLKNIRAQTREELVTAPLGNSYLIRRGEPVLALGSPLGFSDSVAYGIVTSTASRVAVVDTEYGLLTTDIQGSPDGSGVLIDLDGSVIGVITNSFANGTGSITCLPISEIKPLIEDLSNNERQNYAGIRGQDVTQDITDRTGIPRGVLVTEAVPDSPAMLAGIKEYDVIVRIGDQPVETIRQYHRVLNGLQAGDAVEFTAMRRGTEGYAEMRFAVTVESR